MSLATIGHTCRSCPLGGQLPCVCVCVWLHGNAPSNHSPAFKGESHHRHKALKGLIGIIAFGGGLPPPASHLVIVDCAGSSVKKNRLSVSLFPLSLPLFPLSFIIIIFHYHYLSLLSLSCFAGVQHVSASMVIPVSSHSIAVPSFQYASSA